MNKPTPEDMLRQVWSNHFLPYSSWDHAFIIDESLPQAVASSLHPFPDEMAATLDCWRSKMIAAVDEAVQRCKNDPMSWVQSERELASLHAASDEEIIAELARRAAEGSA
jgi:hypothetical protein